MDSAEMLNISDGVHFDESITKIEYHSYSPFLSTFDNNDEIRICIQNQNLNILICESFLYIEGTVKKASDNTLSTTAKLVNNYPAYLFEEIRYEINGIEIDRVRNVGHTLTLKNYISLNDNESKMLLNAGWCPENNIDFSDGNINICMPLKRILGFAEDYMKIIPNVKHELILNRARNDLNAIISPTDDMKFEITKLQWHVPHVQLHDEQKLLLYKFINSNQSIKMSFRSWDMYEYKVLPTTTHQVWAVKSSTRLEKGRFVIFALQTNRRNLKEKDASRFDHANLTDIKVFLNSDVYPYSDLNIDFQNNRYALLYEMYSKFQESYYKTNSQPLLSPQQFKEIAPIALINCSHQMDEIKTGPVDLKIEFKCKSNIKPNTSAYCLILHDRIVEYNPLKNDVKRL
ncbi:uncharacterized protein LOC123298950 [Chrysoperla carnea]|uniref:uncharacterized protein LOC123298950 n=1 Tax=Chrysoperla carnea TaxID=189513 RepID=UPI001D08E471|nr:uncharacterized protein LOC123298950 [Chrysoperla carnea]